MLDVITTKSQSITGLLVPSFQKEIVLLNPDGLHTGPSRVIANLASYIKEINSCSILVNTYTSGGESTWSNISGEENMPQGDIFPLLSLGLENGQSLTMGINNLTNENTANKIFSCFENLLSNHRLLTYGLQVPNFLERITRPLLN